MKQTILTLILLVIISCKDEFSEPTPIALEEIETVLSDNNDISLSTDQQLSGRRNDPAVPTGLQCNEDGSFKNVPNPFANLIINGNHYPYFVGLKDGHWNECIPATVNLTVGGQAYSLLEGGSVNVHPELGELVYSNNINRELTITGLDLDDTPFHALTYTWEIYKNQQLIDRNDANQGRIDISEAAYGDSYLIRYLVSDEQGANVYFDVHVEVLPPMPILNNTVVHHKHDGTVTYSGDILNPTNEPFKVRLLFSNEATNDEFHGGGQTTHVIPADATHFEFDGDGGVSGPTYNYGTTFKLIVDDQAGYDFNAYSIEFDQNIIDVLPPKPVLANLNWHHDPGFNIEYNFDVVENLANQDFNVRVRWRSANNPNTMLGDQLWETIHIDGNETEVYGQSFAAPSYPIIEVAIEISDAEGNDFPITIAITKSHF